MILLHFKVSIFLNNINPIFRIKSVASEQKSVSLYKVCFVYEIYLERQQTRQTLYHKNDLIAKKKYRKYPCKPLLMSPEVKSKVLWAKLLARQS